MLGTQRPGCYGSNVFEQATRLSRRMASQRDSRGSAEELRVNGGRSGQKSPRSWSMLDGNGRAESCDRRHPQGLVWADLAQILHGVVDQHRPVGRRHDLKRRGRDSTAHHVGLNVRADLIVAREIARSCCRSVTMNAPGVLDSSKVLTPSYNVLASAWARLVSILHFTQRGHLSL